MPNLAPFLTGLISLVALAAAHAAPPLIVSQSGPMMVREGEAFAACVVAEGGAVDYQWFHDGHLLAGQTGDTLLLANVSAPDVGGYHAVVSNAGGTSASGDGQLPPTTAHP